MKATHLTRFALLSLLSPVSALNILLSNDDGWAEANLRTLYRTLSTSNSCIVSAPAANRSGSSSLDLPATPRLTPCQYDTCPAFSPAIGRDPSDRRVQYVNSFPVTSVKEGFGALATEFFDSGDNVDLVVTGPNVGSNLDIQVPFSGTVGAAVEAVKRGVPAIAFSGASGEPTAFNAPDQPASATVYAELASDLVAALTAGSGPYLPEGVFLNVNFPETSADRCQSVDDFRWVLSRINPGVISEADAEVCGNGGRLPRERDVVDREDGCFVSVSVGDAADKTTADAERQQVVAQRLGSFLSCLP